jgi:glucose/mannose transport system permease protein
MSHAEIPLASTAERQDRPVWRVVLYGLLLLFAVVFLLPLYVGITTSLKGMSEVASSSIWALPGAPTLENYQLAWTALSPSFLNSVYLVIPAVLISSVLGSLNGYVLSKWQFRGSGTVFALILFGMFIPYQAILIPLVQFLRQIGAYGSIPGLILVHVIYGIPITTLIFRNYYVDVPGELIESGTIDGAGFFGIYRHIILPISIPAFVVVVIWQFTAVWNEFLFAVSITSNPVVQPITAVLAGLGSSTAGTNYGMRMAGSLLTALPTLLVYILLSRYFIRGMLAGCIKG